MFEHVKPGDRIIRMIAGEIPCEMRVDKVDDTLIYCNGAREPGTEHFFQLADEYWTFDRKTGAEVDHDLRWGPQYGRTGSYLTLDGEPRVVH